MEGITSKQILFLVGALLVVGLIFFITKQPKSSQKLDLPVTQQENNTVQNTKDQLKIEDIVVGTGDEAVAGKKVTVNYVGTLENGTKFDSSYDRGTPFSFDLGAGEVIQGWDKGVVGMKVGGKRKLTIPASMGYGARGAGDTIPPNSTLIFEIELLKVE